MRRVVSLSGTAFVLLCIVLILVSAPVGAEDSSKPPIPAADDQYKPIDKPGGPVDTPKGVKPDTVVGKQVPNTGGPPLIILESRSRSS